MKTKLIVSLISLLLLTTVFAAANTAPTIRETSLSETRQISSSGVDVPIWEVNDTWTYHIDDLSVDFSDENQSMILQISVDALPLEVKDTTGDFYTLSFETTMDGYGYLYATADEGPVNISVSFTDLQIQGTLRVEKTTLGLKEVMVSFDKQKFTFNIAEQPFITLPSWLHVISARITTDVTVACDTSVTVLSFPLVPGISWDLVATNFSLNGRIQSFFFTLLDFLNDIATLFGKSFLPESIAALLPVIDINDALTMYLGSNVFQIPSIANAFFCPDTETVEVPAGTYEAYNISLLDGLGYCYYAPAAGNIIKLTGNFQELIPFVKNIDLVLTDITYS
ncbi:MAG: hypothetical protein JXA75_03840 [Candidatus Thermoplasmatota archaeon]|nr:hypothetical protein [Candidatus Thermoplasmatota archaeon]